MSNTFNRTFLVFLGAPGSGKGTQARMLQERLGLPQISTGDLFRYHLKNQTPLGVLAKGYMDKGTLVPDDVTIRMVEERLQQPDCAGGAIFDGFPRTLAQAAATEALLAPWGGITLAPMLVVDDEEVVRRITGRRICRTCGAVYNVDLCPTRVPGQCDLDGGELYQRDDDKPETVRNRLFVYYRQTAPLIGYYFAKGLLVEIEGTLEPDAVQMELLRVLAERGLMDG